MKTLASITLLSMSFLIISGFAHSQHSSNGTTATGQKETPPLPEGIDPSKTPEESTKLFEVADGLRWEQVLSEPEIAQPVFLNFDEKGRMWVVEYRQYPAPAGLKMVSHDKYWRAVYDKVPLPPPHGDKGKDRISIHEDTDGDGTFDSHKVFVDGLNIATACCRGRGGVWVLNPPYLLFYPDKNDDDVPDGDPVVHLSGFGLQDTHSVVNSLRWGPDGWLYAAQGSTVDGAVMRPGIDKKPVRSLGQNIWRYHPESKTYELFAEGGGNAFGVEIDSQGRIFSGHNGGNTRGFHYIQGGYLRKGFSKHGPLSNPHAYGYFDSMPHHNVPRFTHTFLIYDSGSLPQKYQGKLFGVEPLQSQIVMSDLESDGASFKTKDLLRPVTSSDKWFRPVDIKLGPDGAIYVADWYDGRVAHYVTYQEQVDATRGRVYRLTMNGTAARKAEDLSRLKTAQLIDRLKSPYRQIRQSALRLIGDRKDMTFVETLRTQIRDQEDQLALESLWALNLTRPLTDEDAEEFLNHRSPQVRLWTSRLICDDRKASHSIAERLVELAAEESNLEVRSQLACSARRLPASSCFQITRNLIGHTEDIGDRYIPLSIWWAIEEHIDDGRKELFMLLQNADLWGEKMFQQVILSRLMRRLSSTGKRIDLLDAAKLLDMAKTDQQRKLLLSGFEEAYKGRSLASLPIELTRAITKAGGATLPLRIRLQEPEAIAKGLELLSQANDPQIQTIIEVFGEIQHPDAKPLFFELLKRKDEGIVLATLASLARFNHDEIGEAILNHWTSYSQNAATSALNILSSRQAWAFDLVKAVEQKKIKPESVPEDVVRRLTVHSNLALDKSVKQIWGEISGATTQQMKQTIRQFLQELKTTAGDPYIGIDLFSTHCGKCHVLFDTGGHIGPDLTPYQRTDITNLMLQIVNPSAEIRENFETYLIVTTDGRVLTGFLSDKDEQVVTIRGTDGRDVRLPRKDIEVMQVEKKSLMPAGILEKLTPEQRADLFAYLRSAQPLNQRRAPKATR